VNVAKRMGARLEILHVLANGFEKELSKLARLKERFRSLGIRYEFVAGGGSLEEEIIRYAENRRDIMLVLVGEPVEGARKKGRKTKPDRRLLERFQCPVVVLAGN